uniref:Ribokinase n=1 Tax=Thermogladius calderae TaxID=1200300 RepID=A0A7J3XZY3_9CREN
MITVLGSIHVDFVITLDSFPHPGETVIGRSFKIFMGGKGANQAVGCGRLGVKVHMVGKVGKTFREEIIRNFEKNNVDASFVFFDNEVETGTALIYVNERSGENMIAVFPGADYKLRREEVSTALDSIGPSKVFLTQLEIPIDIVEASIKKAHSLYDYVILNPAPYRRFSEEILKYVTLITPNKIEASLLTGIEIRSISDAVKAGKELIRKGVAYAVITLGGDGALLVERDSVLHFKVFPAKVVDSTGAGDAFNAGLAYAISRGESLPEAVKLANAVAALKVTKMGAQEGLPWRSELEAFTSSPMFQSYTPIELR